MIDILTSREIMAAIRFAATATLLVVSIAYGSQLVRRWADKPPRVRVISCALIVESASTSLHQGYWWVHEMLLVVGRCRASLIGAIGCERANRWAELDWLTLVPYVGWLTGAGMILSLWLGSITSDHWSEGTRLWITALFVTSMCVVGMSLAMAARG